MARRQEWIATDSTHRGLVDMFKNKVLLHHRLPSVVRPRAMVNVEIDEEEKLQRLRLVMEII